MLVVRKQDIDVEKYKPIVKKLYQFVNENSGNPNLKNLFGKRLQRVPREFGYQAKKSILVKVYGEMVTKNELPDSPQFRKWYPEEARSEYIRW